ncbi:hypothetical protein G9A89_012398 [Geosiphon pyriformis]|nr:hypothetical protein G9A89_012398 [Geosiphon pyriformis]
MSIIMATPEPKFSESIPEKCSKEAKQLAKPELLRELKDDTKGFVLKSEFTPEETDEAT